MDEKKDAAIDDVVEDASDVEAAEEDGAVAAGQEEAAPAADDSNAVAEQDAENVAEAVEPVEDIAEVAEAAEAAEAADATEVAETVEVVEAAEDVKPEDSPKVAATDEATAPIALETLKKDEPKPKRAGGSGIGDLVIVSIFSIILGVLLAIPSFMSITDGKDSTESTQSSSAGVAATVNGVAISEDEVTKYIMDFRTQQGFEDDSAWGEWMVMYGYTPESLRSDTVELFVSRELVKQAIAEEGIEVADSEVDDYIAMITEQVGGESAFKEALEMEGITLDSYRENVLLALQQQALAKKVAPAAEVDDAQVLELVKMYFPDKVDKDADSLEGVDEAAVEEIRNMLASSAMQQAFEEWMKAYREKANVVIVDMPESLPYNIDLDKYKEQANSGEGSGDAQEPSGEAASVESQDK